MLTSAALLRHCPPKLNVGLRLPGHALRLGWSRRAPSVVTVDVSGDVDASNADALTRYVARVQGPRDGVVLDLSGVTFFGTHGFTALMELIVGQSAPIVVPSRVVERVLHLCDHEARVPVASDADAATKMLRRNSHSTRLR